jgi:glycosyltransferase involved in cell wall biosynthesis
LFFSGYYGAARVAAPQVFTVYDMIHELYVGAMDEKRRCLERAAALIAISHNTAADIVRIYPQIDPSKITVTHLGVDDAFFAPRQRLAPPARPYFLYVGTRVGSKNFIRLVRAFAASGAGDRFDLRVVSRSGDFTAEERAAIGDAPVILQAPLPEDDLVGAYANAHALLYPSEYEGFGLPILEAMAAGTLVAASRAASMPEAGGDVAFYFDPLDVASIARTIATIAELPPEAREERIAAGVQWARTFSWSRCEEQTIALFERLLTARG